jgi:hypothetical protein
VPIGVNATKLSYTRRVALVLFAVALRGLSQEVPADMPRVTVNVYNDAVVLEPILAGGETRGNEDFSARGSENNVA